MSPCRKNLFQQFNVLYWLVDCVYVCVYIQYIYIYLYNDFEKFLMLNKAAFILYVKTVIL